MVVEQKIVTKARQVAVDSNSYLIRHLFYYKLDKQKYFIILKAIKITQSYVVIWVILRSTCQTQRRLRTTSITKPGRLSKGQDSNQKNWESSTQKVGDYHHNTRKAAIMAEIGTFDQSEICFTMVLLLHKRTKLLSIDFTRGRCVGLFQSKQGVIVV